MATFWRWLTGTQPAPPHWAVAVSAAVALLIVASPQAWRLARIAITITHEGGHALASLLTGRRLEGIRLHADTSGETVSRGRPNGPGMVLTALAGYLTPPLIGAGAAVLLALHRGTLLLAIVLALLGVTLILMRNWYGVLAVLVTAGVVFAVAWRASAPTQAAFAYGATWFLLFGGVRPVVELARARARARRRVPRVLVAPGGRRAGPRGRPAARPGVWQPGGTAMSDADQLAGLTGVPGGVWVALFAIVAVAALAVGARLLVPWPPGLTHFH